MKLRIGTRKSRLALAQTNLVREAILQHFPEAEIEIVEIVTEGDRQKEQSLGSFGGKGVFTLDIERALCCGEIDLAVHSAKDMPVELAEGLELGAVLGREDPADVLVTRTGIRAAELPLGSVIGTSSLRRELQMKQINPGVKIKVLRGNVPTRLDKLRSGQYDGIILAAAGLRRLGLDEPQDLHLEYLDQEKFLPAPGQGLLGVECRAGDLPEIMKAIHQPEAALMLMAERRYLTVLGGSCNAPCAVYCRKEGSRLLMSGMYASDGKHPVYQTVSMELNQEYGQENSDEKCTQAACLLAETLAKKIRIKTVSLVGAGPGDAGLLTRKALECIRRADVIIYDNLISGSLLNEAKLDAELVYVGKRAGHHSMKQEEINSVLAEKAGSGRYVVRLKGGDPFIFGRGGEEALSLKKAGIPFEIVPGVSSSYSVPAYAGIPVTDRRYASSFHVITGHGYKEAGEPDYRTLAKEDGTLIFLMGLRHLEIIAERLIENGKDGATPAAVIERGTTAGQRVVLADLAHIGQKVREQEIHTPAILAVGAVTALAEQLNWYGRGALAGTRVMVTGTRHMVREMEEQLKPLGAELTAVSLIESMPVESEKLDYAVQNLEEYDWIVFSSGNGVELFFRKLRADKVDLRKLMHLKFAVIGEKTAQMLEQHGFFCDFVPSAYSSEALANEWIPMLKEDDRVLLMRAKEGSEVLPERLAAAGIACEDAALYETRVDIRRKDELNRLLPEMDYVVLASASAARALAQMASAEQRDSDAFRILSIGPVTTQAARNVGLKIYRTASEYTAEGLTAAILADRIALQDGVREDEGN